jgi:hypothetical protein
MMGYQIDLDIILIECAKHGNLDIVRHMVSQGADIHELCGNLA